MSYERHPVDISALVFGLTFLGIVTGWSLFEVGVVSGEDAAWVLPVVLLSAGGLGVVLALTGERRRSRSAHPTTPLPNQERNDD